MPRLKKLITKTINTKLKISESFFKNEVLQPFITKKIGKFENILIYDIQGLKE